VASSNITLPFHYEVLHVLALLVRFAREARSVECYEDDPESVVAAFLHLAVATV
jgi:hypothetical protein